MAFTLRLEELYEEMRLYIHSLTEEGDYLIQKEKRLFNGLTQSRIEILKKDSWVDEGGNDYSYSQISIEDLAYQLRLSAIQIDKKQSV